MITELSEKQKKFCNEYIIDRNGYDAARRAGYADVTSRDLLGNPLIIAEIEKLERERAERVRVTADDVLRGLMEIWTVSRQRIAAKSTKGTYIRDKDGKQVEGLLDSKSALRALELLGKALGMFDEDKKTEVNVSVGVELASARELIAQEMMRLHDGSVEVSAAEDAAEDAGSPPISAGKDEKEKV